MIKGTIAFSPNCPKCGLWTVADGTLYDPKKVCQCPVDWKRLAKNAGRRAKRLNDVIEEARKQAAKSKLHFGDSDKGYNITPY